jgi:hypothetical protein
LSPKHEHLSEELADYNRSIYVSVSTALCTTLAAFSVSLILYRVSRTHWTGDQPFTKPLPTHRTTQTQNKRTHRHPCLEWRLTPAFERSKCDRLWTFLWNVCSKYISTPKILATFKVRAETA